VNFSIAVNMERFAATQDMQEVAREALELVTLADQGGFETAWAAEHHTIELTVGPNPFTLLMYWAAHTSRIRLGTAVVVAPYWHPIRLAGEAALFDVLTGGRLELGIARGAFQYEFDRMAGGIAQRKGFAYLKELLPTVQALWQGDTEHHGGFWDFPTATSVPKPLQQPHPPIWIAARDPETFAWAVDSGVNIMATPLSRPHAEVGILGQRFAETLAQFPDRPRPRFLMLRRVCVYDRPEDAHIPIHASIAYGLAFDSLFAETAGVVNGFAAPTDPLQAAQRPQYQPDVVRNSMVMGTPDEVVAQLRDYEAVGVDQFCYGANFGLPHAFARRSLELFITKVMPHFAPTVRPAELLAAS
jgi:alkanesulfonate monooxygenase SsuD/methylene tetrahydromethanopterin reductase-like flavin-dependent oxidoreductase (luciferase family)